MSRLYIIGINLKIHFPISYPLLHFSSCTTMSQKLGFCCDDETGETSVYHINSETGEPYLENYFAPTYIAPPSCNEPETPTKYMKFPKGYMARTKKFKTLKANILAGSNQLSYRLLLIPTLVMAFPGLLTVCLSLFEVFIHVQCHKKNKVLKNPQLYYRSPFHVVTSIFCAVCRECDASSKIGHLQDQRKYRYDYIKSMAI